MSSKRNFFMDAFLNIVWLAVFYGLFVVPSVLWLEIHLGVLLFASLSAQLFFFLMRRFIRPVVPMFLVHLILPAAAFYFAPGILSQVAYVGVMVVLGAFSLQQRYKRSATFAHGFGIAAPVALVVLALFMGRQGYDYLYTIYVVLIVLAGVGSKLHIRMTYVNDSLAVITQTSTQPVKKILAFDNKAMAVLGVVVIGLIVFLHIFVLRPALEAAYNMRPSINLDIQMDGDFHIPQTPQRTGGGDMDMFIDSMYREPWLLWVILERILMVAVPVVGVLAIGYAIFRVARSVYRRMNIRDNRDHKHASGYEDVKEFIRTPRARRSWFFGPRGEHKLRRLFRETMTRHIKKGTPIKNTDTPVEMAGKVQAEDISGLAEEYAAVRYGRGL